VARDRRSDVAEFLLARRAALSPAEVGLAPGTRRRTAGLRREEVAQLAGVSVSWYTWLEQGRPINPSIDVLDALARALRLDHVERDHLVALCGHPARGPVDSLNQRAPAGLVDLLNALDPCPAYLLGPTWNILAWNRAQERLAPIIPTLAPEDRNLVWIVFAEPTLRTLIGDWSTEARRVLSQFRADTTPIRSDPAVVALVQRLKAASPEFADWWPRHDVAGFEERVRSFHHPIEGTIQFRYEQLIPAGEPDLRIIVHVPISAG
jgi:transcriptional regulator with XRE-family HTH domain